MQFANPVFLIIGGIACGILVLAEIRLRHRRRVGLERVASRRLLPVLCAGVSTARRNIRFGALLVGVAAIFAALARPQAGYRLEEIPKRGIDIILALDTSKSMLAEDVAPNRLERAKLAILDFVDKLDGDRVGLMPFAGEAYLACPLTHDKHAFRENLDAVDTELVPTKGTDLAAAIAEARRAMKEGAHQKILVLITDGEDLEARGIAEAKKAAEDGVKVFTVGVGTPAGEIIPIARDKATSDFVRDSSGQTVRSRLDEKTLEQIAEVTGGIYRPLGARGQGIEDVYQEKLRLVPKEELMQRQRRVPLERCALFLWPATILLGLGALIGESRRRGGRTARRLGPVALLAVAGVLAGGDARGQEPSGSAPPPVQSQDGRLNYNAAVDAYKAGKFEEASRLLRESFGGTDPALHDRAWYGLGNAAYRRGESVRAANPEAAVPLWVQAVESYGAALEVNPDDADARFNRDLVRRKLEALKQQLEQQKQQKKKKDQAGKDQAGKDQAGKDQAGKDQAGKDQAGKDQAGKDQAGKDQAGKDQAGKAPQMEAGSQDQKGPSGDATSSNEGGTGSKGGATASARTSTGSHERASGDMTAEQARRLLESLRDEEGRMLLIPGGSRKPVQSSHDRKDW